MVTPSVGTVVLVTFPFSDLSGSKLRPAVVLAGVDKSDWLLCQVTSNPYSDPKALELSQADFDIGSLQRISYVRPGKLFSANTSLIHREVGKLNDIKFLAVVDAIVAILKPGE